MLSNDLEHFYGARWVAEQRILREFYAVVDGSNTGLLKPDPHAFLLAAHQLGVAVTDPVFLGGQVWNTDAAAALGAAAIWVDITPPPLAAPWD
ncbi:hypothetical protein LWP59_38130 [Amycolatopsis acidiphila]|uniref:HAD-IA family hydrolase n=1 Tax=Amycolatopsis acidiphila TaxID=715473 RepID=A0A558ABQ9_9PSEU|nr:hypothetical protein [Amycolatopsis acidiphila]TVT21702.1 hypothetical protein FNH06_16225 [Amycolatopsis acidiphila]UIJ59759.1 hypothetical protein LWP59_38130 [Amycolatopsis acidiphila]GHG98468.1 hypothetical protein GCM10017788_78590 [Amycolatopsis acidiphila]